MRVLQLGKAYPPVNMGGVELVIKFFTEGLSDAGIACDALGVNNSYRFHSDFNSDHSRVYREKLIVKRFSTLFSFHLIIRLHKIASSYSIIHIHHPDPMSALALYIVKPKCKIVLHWHSDIVKQKITYLIFRPLEMWLLNRADLIACTSPKYLEDSPILQPYKFKCITIPIGIEQSESNENNVIAESIRIENPGKFIVLAIGRFSYYKGFKYLIDAFKHLDNNYKLFIIGDGEEFIMLQEMINESGLKDNIVLLGFQSDVIKNAYLKACDVFVLPSIYKSEAYGIVQIEAMAFGKPVISTRIEGSGVDWVNQNGQSGFTVPIKDSYSIAKSITQLREDKELYNKLSKGALSRYKSMFTTEIMISALIKAYHSL